METNGGNRCMLLADSEGTKRMDQLIVASVQQRMRIFATVDDYRVELQRFLRIARHKHAALVIFPELGGTMLVPPMLRNSRTALLKYAELGRRRKTPPLRRYASQLARWTALHFSADFATTLAACLQVASNELWQNYCTLFSELALEHGITIVAPSGYFPDPTDGVIRNLTAVFGPDGKLVGHQAKVMLHAQDKEIAQAGTDWDVIHTEAGTLGLLVGSDVLYPEIGRLLAYKGAEILIGQGACPTTVLYQKLRAGILARMQDNQLFAAASYLVGRNDLHGRNTLSYTGRSAIFAPQELTPRFNGVLVEMGSASSEGVLSADWNYLALRKLWDGSDTPIRRDVPFKQVNRVIASLYARLQYTPDLLEESTLGGQSMAGDRLLAAGKPILRLDELPVTSTITRRWPPIKVDYSTVNSLTVDMPDLTQMPSTNVNRPLDSEESILALHRLSSSSEDETEEMDALPDPQPDQDTEQKE